MVNNSQNKKFNTFLSYKRNDVDQLKVRELLRLLRHYDLVVWFDEDELRPGISWLDLMETGIKNSQSGVVLIGSNGMGPWQDQEVQALLQLAVSRLGLPVIPVFLPSVIRNKESIPLFLSSRGWVDLSAGFTVEGITQLIWGITGKKPTLSPLPALSSTTKDIHEYIKKRGHLVHKLKAKDSTGRWAYYFVLVEPELEHSFLKSFESKQTVDLEEFGKVVASCYGEEPDEKTKKFLRDKYGW